MGARGQGRVREFGVDMYILIQFKWITNKDLLYSTGNSAQCYVAARMEGSWGRMCTCICMARSLCCSPETITTLLIGYEKVKVLVTQPCLTLCDPIDYSLPGSSVRGLLQARILKWIAIPSSRESSRPRNRT